MRIDLKSYGQKRSKQQEERIAGELGGQVQKASGATDFAKGDVSTKDILIEAKFTTGKNYTLKLADLQKIEQEALRKLKTWVFQIEFRLGRQCFAVISRTSYEFIVNQQLSTSIRTKSASTTLTSAEMLGPEGAGIFVNFYYPPYLSNYVVLPWAHYLELFHAEHRTAPHP